MNMLFKKPKLNIEDINLVINNLLSDVGLNASLRSVNLVKWNEAASSLNYLPVDYSNSAIDYQLSYWKNHEVLTVDISLVLFHDTKPCGIWPLPVTIKKNGEWQIGFEGAPLASPLFASWLSGKSIKCLIRSCLAFLDRVIEETDQSSINIIESYSNTDVVSEWHDYLMKNNAKVKLFYDLFLDLSPTISEIKSSFRKSYKSLIASGSKFWKVEIPKTISLELWDEFRRLHQNAAGRVTRSDETWLIQLHAINSGDAFFVYLRDSQEKMVGGGLFHLTANEVVYAVGAYDRSLFHKPLGHVVQYFAIAEMKRRDLTWYKLGARYYSSYDLIPLDKEMNISNFKQGFSSHIFPRFLLNYCPITTN